MSPSTVETINTRLSECSNLTFLAQWTRATTVFGMQYLVTKSRQVLASIFNENNALIILIKSYELKVQAF